MDDYLSSPCHLHLSVLTICSYTDSITQVVHPAHHQEEGPHHHPDVDVEQPQQEHHHMVGKEDDMTLAGKKDEYLSMRNNKYLLEAVNIGDKVKDKLVVVAASDRVREEGGGSEPDDDDHRGDDDRDDNVDGEDDQPYEQQHSSLRYNKYIVIIKG